jgi:hypothetical protein
VTTLEWSETEDGYESAGYRIMRSGTHGWTVRCDLAALPTVTRRRPADMPVFGSLKSARAAALHMEVVRIRSLKLIRHVALSLMMVSLSVGFYVAMATGTQTYRLEWFVLAGAALFIGLSEGLDAFVLVVSDGWDHRYEVPKVTALDRIIPFVVTSTPWRKPLSAQPTREQERVRPLT